MDKRRQPFAERIRNFVWPRMGLRRYAIYIKNKVLRLSASPHAIAAGFASGAAVSIFPFIGFHFLLGFVLAFCVRGSMLAAALGTAVGNPLTFPIFFSATYQVGNALLGFAGWSGESSSPGADSASGFMASSITALLPLIKAMTVGAVPLSIVAFAACYFPIRSLVRHFQEARRQRLARRGVRLADDTGKSAQAPVAQAARS